MVFLSYDVIVHISTFVYDRRTYNALRRTCKILCQMIDILPIPYPVWYKEDICNIHYNLLSLKNIIILNINSDMISELYNLYYLKEVNIKQCDYKSFRLENLPNIERLNLYYGEYNVIRCPKLKSISIYHVNKFTCDSFSNVEHLTSEFSKYSISGDMKNLSYLSLKNSSNIGDNIICPNIKVIKFYKSDFNFNQDLDQLEEISMENDINSFVSLLLSLRRITIYNLIDNKFLSKLSSSLKYLNISKSKCHNINLERFENLEFLSINNLNVVLPINMPSLKILDIKNTKVSHLPIANNLERLTLWNISLKYSDTLYYPSLKKYKFYYTNQLTYVIKFDQLEKLSIYGLRKQINIKNTKHLKLNSSTINNFVDIIPKDIEGLSLSNIENNIVLDGFDNLRSLSTNNINKIELKNLISLRNLTHRNRGKLIIPDEILDRLTNYEKRPYLH